MNIRAKYTGSDKFGNLRFLVKQDSKDNLSYDEVLEKSEVIRDKYPDASGGFYISEEYKYISITVNDYHELLKKPQKNSIYELAICIKHLKKRNKEYINVYLKSAKFSSRASFEGEDL